MIKVDKKNDVQLYKNYLQLATYYCENIVKVIVKDQETWLLSEKGLGIGTFPFQDHIELPIIL